MRIGAMRVMMAAVLSAALAAFSAAQDEETAFEDNPNGKGGVPSQMRPSMEQIQRMQAASEAMRKRQMESLKKTNPKLYEAQRENLEATEKIEDVVSRWRKSQMSEEEARRELFPLVEQQVQPEIDGLESRIESLEKQLEFLKKARKKPRLIVERHIDELLVAGPRSGRGRIGAPPSSMAPPPMAPPPMMPPQTPPSGN